MIYAPVHIVDTSIVPAERAAAFLDLVRERIVPVMTDAGATLLSCIATSPAIDEDVRVLLTWWVADHAAWNVVRRNFFIDPRWHAMCAEAAMLRIGGDRRFFYPVAPEAGA